MRYKKMHDVWGQMKGRCYNENHRQYHNYGGRGILVSPEWLIFENFYQDMKDSWVWGLTLERKNNNSGYSKENCVWATYKENEQNKRTCKLTAEQVQEIRRLKDAGWLQKDLATKFQVSRPHISMIVNNQTWSNV